MPVSSDSQEPVKTSADSLDTLPLKGYSCDQLAAYLQRQLGSPTWIVELTKQQILDCIQDALSLFSEWIPIPRPLTLQMIRGQYNYLDGIDIGQGIARVDFVESTILAQDVLYAGMISPAPLIRTGLDEYDTFLRWRKTWQRVASSKPDWYYDEYEGLLYIHNPIERYHCGVICYFPYSTTQSLNQFGARWVKEYALAKARFLLSETLLKYSGAVPGPVGNLQMDGGKRDLAIVEMDKLKESLKSAQRGAGISID